jgi:hypothetical protein
MPRDTRERKGSGPAPLAAVFLTAFLVRLAVAQELAPLALWTTPQLDARENLVWATSLAAGNDRWPSPPTHGPTYPYFLAGLLRLLGGSLPAVRAVQTAEEEARALLGSLLSR